MNPNIPSVVIDFAELNFDYFNSRAITTVTI